MVTYYVDNDPVLPRLTNYPYNKVRQSTNHENYCNAQEAMRLIKLVMAVVMADDRFCDNHTNELDLTGLSEWLQDDFEGWTEDDLDWFIFCVVDGMGIV